MVFGEFIIESIYFNFVNMFGKKNLDELSPASRDYYERALMKMSLSLVFAAFAFFFLGLAAKAGGLSSGYGSFAVSNLVTCKTLN